MKFHPDVLAAHAEFGGDLETMQKLYEYPELVARISQQDAELERLRREVEALRVLSFSGNALVQIVEGLQGSMEHGTWRDEKGMRLKDTNAWCLFYTTFKASAQAAKAEDTAR